MPAKFGNGKKPQRLRDSQPPAGSHIWDTKYAASTANPRHPKPNYKRGYIAYVPVWGQDFDAVGTPYRPVYEDEYTHYDDGSSDNHSPRVDTDPHGPEKIFGTEKEARDYLWWIHDNDDDWNSRTYQIEGH
jgi:hypothetical protein